MNLVGIEEHQGGDLVSAQEATLACVIVPMAKVWRHKYSDYQ